ncbi:MAG TPA: glycosyltransferase [Actinomycetota bacterium]
MSDAVTVVIATRNRCAQLLGTLGRLRELRPAPPIVVVDNGSTDRTAQTVRRQFPEVRVLALRRNLGAPARNLGALVSRTPYIAFSDDDSWWAPGALQLAVKILDARPRLALLAARTLVGPRERPDPLSAMLARSPLPRPPGAPGPTVLGFLACSAVLRRVAFLGVGGFNGVLHFLGEEELLCYDLAAAGWERAYVADVVAHHHPSPSRPDAGRRRALQRRNAMLTAVMRRPGSVALRAGAELARAAMQDPDARRALLGALARLPAALRQRMPPSLAVERELRMLEDGRR